MSLTTVTAQFSSHPPPKRQLPSFRRCDNPPPFHLTERDQQIILRVNYYYLLSTHQIEALLFNAPETERNLKTQCQRRLQLLFHHGFLGRIQQAVVLGEGRKPFIYAIDKLGAVVVAQLLDIDVEQVDWNRKAVSRTDPYRLKHDLAISDTWVMLENLVQSQQIQMPYWMTQRSLKSASFRDRLPRVSVGKQWKHKVPDGYFTVNFPGTTDLAHFFYEEDAGTQKQKQWSQKVKAYLQFKRDNRSLEHFGCRNFRVLVKTTTPKRLELLRKWTAAAGGGAMFWFTTHDRMSIWQPQTLLESIWQPATIAGEYSLMVGDSSEFNRDDG